MKLINTLLTLFLATQVLGCADNFRQSQNGLRQKASEEILYKSENGRNVDVFNIKELWFSQEGVEYLSRRNFKYGEFGGQIEFCSNQDYYCLGGGLNVAIPKNINGQKEWQFKGRSCRSSESLSTRKPTTIVCRFKGHSKKFTYLPDRGVISYSYDRGSGESYKYKLIGKKGLFAPQESTDEVNDQS